MRWRRPPVLAASALSSMLLVTALPGEAEQSRRAEGGDPAERGAPPAMRGVALGLFAPSADHDYEPQLEEIRSLGATHVAIVVTYFQRDVTSDRIYAHPELTPPLGAVRRALRAARRLGLETFLFPYVRVEEKHSPADWRGTLRPEDRDAWYRSYGSWIEGLARLADEQSVSVLSIGSEMSTMDVDEERWREMIRRVRRVYRGRVTYSANWDHYEAVRFWEALDLVGVTGYFELVDRDLREPTVEDVVHGWREWHARLMRWQAQQSRPLLLTEVGYRSTDGAAALPWRWGEERPTVDLEEQRVAYEAFVRVWSDEPRLAGVFFWNWWGEGGPSCADYTPRHKPAEGVLRRWYGAPAAIARDRDAG